MDRCWRALVLTLRSQSRIPPHQSFMLMFTNIANTKPFPEALN
jgi:hypothetical protein